MSRVPVELYADPTWTVLDPNSAQIVAIFYDETAAQDYIAWRNESTKEDS